MLLLLVVLAFAALPKERKRFNKKCTEITKNLAKLVTQYNLLVDQYNAIPQQQQPLQPATLDAVKKQEFCWGSICEGECQQCGCNAQNVLQMDSLGQLIPCTAVRCRFLSDVWC